MFQLFSTVISTPSDLRHWHQQEFLGGGEEAWGTKKSNLFLSHHSASHSLVWIQGTFSPNPLPSSRSRVFSAATPWLTAVFHPSPTLWVLARGLERATAGGSGAWRKERSHNEKLSSFLTHLLLPSLPSGLAGFCTPLSASHLSLYLLPCCPFSQAFIRSCWPAPLSLLCSFFFPPALLWLSILLYWLCTDLYVCFGFIASLRPSATLREWCLNCPLYLLSRTLDSRARMAKQKPTGHSLACWTWRNYINCK